MLPISVGQSLNGTLTTSSCRSVVDSTCYAQMYEFTFSSTRTVTINLTSSAFDAYLVLLTSSGTALEQDDDDGGGANSRISRSLSPGTYRIEATSFWAGSTGAYTLSLTSP